MTTVVWFPSFLNLLAYFPLTNSLVLPLYDSGGDAECEKSRFKDIVECQGHTGFALHTTVTFTHISNPNIHHRVRLLLDTGSAVTWLATDSTKFFDVTVSINFCRAIRAGDVK